MSCLTTFFYQLARIATVIWMLNFTNTYFKALQTNHHVDYLPNVVYFIYLLNYKYNLPFRFYFLVQSTNPLIIFRIKTTHISIHSCEHNPVSCHTGLVVSRKFSLDYLPRSSFPVASWCVNDWVGLFLFLHQPLCC